MTVNTLTQIFFSPTGTTRQILSAIGQGINADEIIGYDLTPPEKRDNFQLALDRKDELVLLGIPVYEEHVPDLIWDALNRIEANGQSIILIAVYGNIGFGMTLKELETWAKRVGFNVIAAGAFIGEHSFSHKGLPLAKGRPDIEDMRSAREFGKSVLSKIQHDIPLNPDIPGHLSLMSYILPKNSSKFFAHYAEADMKKCTRCNRCLNVCPSGAIDLGTLKIDHSKCLHCFACVRVCASSARKIELKLKPFVNRALSLQTQKRKLPQIFI
ncbi:MAG: EFR1 family ferrodoxin [Candidatus Marinimicrobia bacterium]|nr:EFR1 family ferrodoxin [Candidatus Neomarinimicrobiota bacterium]